MNQASKTYSREFFSAMAAYAVLIILSAFLMRRLADSVWRYPIAVMPTLPLLFALGAYLRYLNRLDELQKRIQLNAIGFATGVTLILTFTYGLSEKAGLPQLSYIWVMPIFIVIWGAATYYFNHRYR